MKTFESKLSTAQEAWFIHDNRVTSMPVGSIRIQETIDPDLSRTHTTTDYGFRIRKARDVEWLHWPEAKCFATKEELLASL